jgi:hypothetical protein
MDPLENQTDQTSFNFIIDSMIAFPSHTFKYVNETFRTERDQKMIIRFLHNRRADAHDITQRLQAQFAQDVYALRIIQFWIGEVSRNRQDLHNENDMGRSPLDDLDRKFWLY